MLGACGDSLGVRFAGARLAVRQEHNDAERLLSGRLGERLRECTGDVRPALGVETANPALGVVARIRCHARPSRRVATHTAGERDQPEPIALPERAEQLNQCGLRLLDLFARHRTRDVNHGDDVATQRCSVSRRAGGEQQHEVAVLAGGMMRHEREANQPARQRQQELEVASGCASLRERHLEAIVAARDLDLMRGRIRIAEARSTIDFETKTARGGLPITVPQVVEPPGIAGAVEQLRVLQGDLASLAGSDGEHARTDQPLAGELDQRGIAFLAYDGFINRARLRRIHRFAAQLLVALPE